MIQRYGRDPGPSPRVWGLREDHPVLEGVVRSIPTRVGTTRAGRRSGVHGSVHPHACGDYWARSVLTSGVNGPSPRVWGLLPKGKTTRGTPRSIPTRVGTTPTPTRAPRAGRSIPTRVGTTLWAGRFGAGRPVHPHACGDYTPWRPRPTGRAGPSPRVWGLQALPRRARHPRRSIPTRVGTTMLLELQDLRPAVHPHACGDYAHRAAREGDYLGPSPRVWGLRPPGPKP